MFQKETRRLLEDTLHHPLTLNIARYIITTHILPGISLLGDDGLNSSSGHYKQNIIIVYIAAGGDRSVSLFHGLYFQQPDSRCVCVCVCVCVCQDAQVIHTM